MQEPSKKYDAECSLRETVEVLISCIGKCDSEALEEYIWSYASSCIKMLIESHKESLQLTQEPSDQKIPDLEDSD